MAQAIFECALVIIIIQQFAFDHALQSPIFLQSNNFLLLIFMVNVHIPDVTF